MTSPADFAAGWRFAIVVARFNQEITSRLLAGAEETLLEHGVRREDVDVFWTPGALELPLAALELARSSRYQGIIALGCVIKHETLHFELVAEGTTHGLVRVSLETGVPVLQGVLACYTEQQAIDRAGAGGGKGNKGREAALSALEMARMMQTLRGVTPP